MTLLGIVLAAHKKGQVIGRKYGSAHLSTGLTLCGGTLAALFGFGSRTGLQRHCSAALCDCTCAKTTSRVPIERAQQGHLHRIAFASVPLSATERVSSEPTVTAMQV